jgi:DNA-binding MarR family transcriptional regulator
MKLFSKFHAHLNYTLVRLAPTLLEEEFLNCYAALRGAGRLCSASFTLHHGDAPVFPMNLDKKDFALIEALQQNASQRLEDLAKLVHLAPSSVHDRLQRLERIGIIRQ